MDRRKRYQDMRERDRRRKELKQSLSENQHDAYLLDVKEFQELWFTYQATQGVVREKAKEKLADIWKLELNGFSTSSITGYLAGFYPAGQDAVILAKLALDMKKGGDILTKYVIKSHPNGKSYIIIKGYSGLRTIFTGTRYLAENTKIIQMGVGQKAVQGMIKGGGVFTLVLLSGYRVVDYMIRDEATWVDLIGGLAVDLVKVATTITFASIAVASISTFMVVAGPLAAAVFIGTAVAVGLEVLDYKYGITNQVIESLYELEKQLIFEFKKRTNEFNRYMSTTQGQHYFIQRFFGVKYRGVGY